MPGPRAARRDEVAALLALREREGLTYAELSKRCGLAPATLSWWSWRLRREGRATTAFAELEVRDDDVASKPAPQRISLHRGEWRVEIDDEVSVARLRPILELLAELPC